MMTPDLNEDSNSNSNLLNNVGNTAATATTSSAANNTNNGNEMASNNRLGNAGDGSMMMSSHYFRPTSSTTATGGACNSRSLLEEESGGAMSVARRETRKKHAKEVIKNTKKKKTTTTRGRGSSKQSDSNEASKTCSFKSSVSVFTGSTKRKIDDALLAKNESDDGSGSSSDGENVMTKSGGLIAKCSKNEIDTKVSELMGTCSSTRSKMPMMKSERTQQNDSDNKNDSHGKFQFNE